MINLHTRPFILSELKLEVTYKCNLNCIHCSSEAKPTNITEMKRDDCLRIIGEASKLGAKKIAFSGGEPLMWSHIIDAVKTAQENGLQSTIYTSGNVLEFEPVAKRLKELGVKRFIFSVFGSTSSSHQRITRVQGSFEKTLNAMKIAKGIGLSTEAHFVPISINYHELVDIVNLVEEYGASVVSVLRLVPQGRAALLINQKLNRLQNYELRSTIRSLRKAGHTIRTGSPYNFLLLSETPKCCAAIDRLIVDPDLRLYPCDAFKQIKAEELTGTLDYSSLESYTLIDCWNKSPYLRMVRDYLTTPFTEPCESCKLLDKCLSGCLAQKVVIHGDMNKRPDPDCPLQTSKEK
jgi:radical SAM protein with 4Fe4S-binding SPASM domain